MWSLFQDLEMQWLRIKLSTMVMSIVQGKINGNEEENN